MAVAAWLVAAVQPGLVHKAEKKENGRPNFWPYGRMNKKQYLIEQLKMTIRCMLPVSCST